MERTGRVKSKRLSFAIVILSSFVLTSCWNVKELTDLSFISAVGIDKAEDGYKVSIQAINVSEVAAGQQGASGNSAPTVVYSTTGDTIFEAFRKMTKVVPRKIFFPHTDIIVISEKFARDEGINKVFDWFERDHEFRTNVQVIIARDTEAEKILMVPSPIEKVTAYNMGTEIAASEKVWGENLVVEIDDVIGGLISKGKEVAITGVKIVGDWSEASKGESLRQTNPLASIELSGIGIFKDDTLVKWLDNDAARGVNWIGNRIESTIVNLDCKGVKDAIAIEVIRTNVKIKTFVKACKPSITVILNEEGNLGEVDCEIDLSKPDVIYKLEEQLEKEIKSEMNEAITVAQETKSDIFGFGDVLHRQHPREWKEFEKDWTEVFSEMEVNLQVNAFIRRTGMRNNPFIKE